MKKAFGSKIVLDGVDLDVGHGESVVVIGGSGSGKSVTVKCILGLLDARCRLDQDRRRRGRLLWRAADARGCCGKFGMLFQGAALFDSLPGLGERRLRPHPRPRHGPAQAKEIALTKLAAVGLGADVGELYPAELSGGMQKRVALARAIAAEPEIIFFDEPTTGLDPIMGDVINELIVKCVRDLGATAVSITHDMASARKIADRIAMIYEGRIIWNGKASDIDHSGNPYVDQFIHGRADGPIQMEVRAL